MASSARIDELLKKFEENPRRYFAPLANEYRKAGDVERAIQICQEHLPQQPGHMSGHIVFGQALFESRQFDEARRVFHAALALDPENLIALRHLGDIARDEGDVGGAREWYQRVLDADPRNEEIAAQIAALPAEGAVATDTAGAGRTSAPTEAWSPDAAGDDLSTVTTAEHEAADAVMGAPAATADDAGAQPPPPEEIAPREFTNDIFGAPEPEPAPPAPAEALHIERSTAAAGAVDDSADLDLDLSSLDAEPSQGAGFVDLPAGAPPASGASNVADSVFPSLDLDATEDTHRGEPAHIASAEAVERHESARDHALPYDLGPLAAAAEAESATTGPAALGAAIGDAPPSEASPTAGFEVVDESPDDAGATALPWLVDAPPAEPAPPAPAPERAGVGDKPLGLESMEFVPPPREEQGDPALGHLLRDDAPPAATPPAFVTETMAELYLQQGFRDEALGVYRQLLANNPADASLRERVAQLEGGSRSSVGAAGISDSVIEAAQQRQTARAPGPTARAFFASLAVRRPLVVRDAEVPAEDSGESAHGAAEATAEGERRYDDFGFPIGVEAAIGADQTRTEVGGAAGDWQVVEMPAAADTTSGDALDALPADAAIEPATLDYAAEVADADAPARQAADLSDVGVVSPTEREALGADALTGDRYGSVDENGDAAIAEAPPRPATGPVDSLFAGPSDEEDAAAATLAGAFGSTSPGNRTVTGADRAVRTTTAADVSPVASSPASAMPPSHAEAERATRPAASELSLDHVFRDTPRRSAGQRRQSPAFSFDQFFADAPTHPDRREGEPSAPAESNETGEDGGSADIEQFNAWLEGLKKK